MPSSPMNKIEHRQSFKPESKQPTQQLQQKISADSAIFETEVQIDKYEQDRHKNKRSSSQEPYGEGCDQQIKLFKNLNKATMDLKKKLEHYTLQNSELVQEQKSKKQIPEDLNNEKSFKSRFNDTSVKVQNQLNQMKSNILGNKQRLQQQKDYVGKLKQYDPSNYDPLKQNLENKQTNQYSKQPNQNYEKQKLIINEFNVEDISDFDMVLASKTSIYNDHSIYNQRSNRLQNEDIDLDFTPRFFFKNQNEKQPKVPMLNLNSLQINKRK